jgi:hypothetical protein
MNNIYNNVVNNEIMEFRAKEVFTGPMPHGFTWGLVLLKDLTKPPIPGRTYMSEKSF